VKRNDQLIQSIMLMAQEGNLNGPVGGFSDEEVRYHRALCVENGYLKGNVARNYVTPTEIPASVAILGVTSAGHDYLDALGRR
jgi:hypothetical protein